MKTNLKILISLFLIIILSNCGDDKKLRKVEDYSYLKGQKKVLVLSYVKISVDQYIEKLYRREIDKIAKKVNFTDKYRRAYIRRLLIEDKNKKFNLILDDSLNNEDLEDLYFEVQKKNFAKIKKSKVDLVLVLESNLFISDRRDDLEARKIENFRLINVKTGKAHLSSSRETFIDAFYTKKKVLDNIKVFKQYVFFLLTSERDEIVRYLLNVKTEYEPEEYDFKSRNKYVDYQEEADFYEQSRGGSGTAF